DPAPLAAVGGGIPVDVAAVPRGRSPQLTGILPDEPRLLGPGVAPRVSGAAVVHDATVGRPGEAPAGGHPVAALAVGRLVLSVVVDARVNPGAAGRRAVVLEVAEGRQRLAVPHRVLAARRPGVAVDLLDNQLGRRLVRDCPAFVRLLVHVVPDQNLN